jgi:hypothetical protein
LQQSFTLVANSTGQSVKGLFDLPGGTSLAQGAIFQVNGEHIQISYRGGLGHDVTFFVTT